jgi:hypothetical protein
MKTSEASVSDLLQHYGLSSTPFIEKENALYERAELSTARAGRSDEVAAELMRLAWSSPAALAIAPLQDFARPGE